METKPMKLLIIEDDRNDCNVFINCVKNRKDIEIVALTDSDIEGLKYTKIKHPDGIVLDLELNNSANGNSDSFKFLSRLKEMHLNYEPIIIVTTHINSKRTYEMLHKEGVDLIMYKEHPSYSCEKVLNNFINLRPIDQKRSMKTMEEEIKDEKNKISNYISNELELIGIPSKMVGRRYLHDAIKYLVENENSNINVIQYLVKVYKKSDTTITNGMKNAILHAWGSMPVDDLFERYNAVINPKRGVPTTMEFVYYYRDKVKNML